MFDPLSAIAIMAGTGLSAGLNFWQQGQANQQNMMMNTGAWKAQQVAQEASALGVSPLAVLGNTGSSTPMQAATAPDFGQSLGRAAAATSPAEDRLAALQIQRLELENKALSQDVVAKQLVNSRNAVSFQPSVPVVPLPRMDPRYEPEIKPALQRLQSTSGIIVAPSAASQQSMWSPIPGLPANPPLFGDVLSGNLGNQDPAFRPDFSRYVTDMTGALGQ